MCISSPGPERFLVQAKDQTRNQERQTHDGDKGDLGFCINIQLYWAHATRRTIFAQELCPN
jgi:hypothetical protein